METRKKVQYFKVKWVNIATAGNTWEPVAHFIGDPAKQALSAFRQKRAADEAAADAARAQRRSGNTPGNTPGNDNVNGDNAATGTDRDIEMATDDTNGANARHLQFRKKHSDVWKFFAPKSFEVSSNAYLAKCKICSIDIKALTENNGSIVIELTCPFCMYCLHICLCVVVVLGLVGHQILYHNNTSSALHIFCLSITNHCPMIVDHPQPLVNDALASSRWHATLN